MSELESSEVDNKKRIAILSALHNNFLYIVFAVMVVIVGWYAYEDNLDIHEEIKYYGNVTVKPRFTYPEKIELITFGWQREKPSYIEFVNELWCAPINTRKQKELFKIRHTSFMENGYVFENQLPRSVQAVVDDEIIPTHQIGLLSRREIRAKHKIDPYDTWNMDEIRPLESSDCHITAKLIWKTPRFGINKTIDFIGHEFQYIVPSELEQKEENS